MGQAVVGVGAVGVHPQGISYEERQANHTGQCGIISKCSQMRRREEVSVWSV